MKNYPIPPLELSNAIKTRKYENLYVSCKIESKGLRHYITVKSNVSNTKTYWFYNEKTNEYYEIGA